MIPVYLLWSAVYLPWSLSLAAPYIEQVQGMLPAALPFVVQRLLLLLLIPLAVIIALLYSGVYYHLWYFPALLLSMLVLRWWKRKHSLKVLLAVSFVLLLFGATETYYGFCGQFFQSLLHYYYAVFFTTRNFLFFALFYVTLGYYMGKQQQPASSLCFLKLLLSIAALIGEGLLLQTTERLTVIFCWLVYRWSIIYFPACCIRISGFPGSQSFRFGRYQNTIISCIR